MYKDKKILAIIPARGGSKGIPDKNIADVNGEPLIGFTIKAALGSKYIDRTLVSTDSSKIAAISAQLGIDVPFLRPAYLASDEAKTIDVLVDCVDRLAQQGETYDLLVLLQPTQPLRQACHIDEAIEMMVDNNLTSLVSVSKVKENPVLTRTINAKGQLVNLLDTSSTVRRQDFNDFYRINGAVYINIIDHNFNSETSLNDNEYPYIMAEQYDIDIDEPADLERLRSVLN